MRASVIVPAHNSADTIEGCLESILGQGGMDFEVIVVDDGSTDDTGELVKKYPVKLIAQENRGPAAARNLGARNADGEILVFTDSDCAAGENWLSEMLKPFENPEIVGVQGRYKTRQRSLIARFAQYEIVDRYERMSRYEYINFIGSYSAAYRSEIFLGEGGFDESFPTASGEDPELSFRLADKGYKMVFNPNAVVYHRHPDTLGKYLRQKFYRAYWRVALYRKHAGKITGEAYTPLSVPLQTGFALLASLLLVIFIFQGAITHILFLISLLLLSTIPFSIKMSRRERKFLVITPPIAMLRNMAFVAGTLYGLFSIKNEYPRVKLIKSQLKGKVLDIGYVSGTLHAAISATSPDVIGLDTRTKKMRNCVRGDAENMPLKNDGFDTIIAGELIEHLRRPENFVMECFRVLKKEGVLIITTPNKNSWSNRIARSSFTDLHVSLFDEKGLVELCRKKGFEIKEFAYLPYTKESSEGSKYPYLFWLRKVVHKIMPNSLREEMIAVCQK